VNYRDIILKQYVLRARFRWCNDNKLYYVTELSVKGWHKPIGYKHPNGHTYVYIGKHRFNLRDIVWVWHNGPLPEGGVKHIDGDPSNNVPENLAPVIPVSFL
jgi:hypothetical protein